MQAFLIIVHVIACLVLIAVILLQAGRGGGLSDFVGGSPVQNILGTQTNQFMTRATEVCAVLFIITSLSLGVITTQRGKSLIERERRAARAAVTQAVPAQDAPAAAEAAATTESPAAEPANAPAA